MTEHGLRGEYFHEVDLKEHAFTRRDSKIDFSWHFGAPDESIEPESFSVRWTGYVVPRYSEPYTFITTSDDGVKLRIDGRKLIDNWTDHPGTEDRGTIDLEAGRPYSLELEFYERGGGAEIRLEWSSPTQSREVVPEGRLFTERPTTPLEPRGFRVSGWLRGWDDRPVPGAVVVAFDRDLRDEQMLGKATTDRAGHYEIAYSEEQFVRAEKRWADLQVRVLNGEPTLASSEIRFNAGPEEVVDFILGGDVLGSEYERLVAACEPVLDGLPPTELSEDDFGFLAAETGWTAEITTLWAAAARSAEESGCPTALFYGVGRVGLPVDVEGLLSLPGMVVADGVQRAFDEGYVPDWVAEDEPVVGGVGERRARGGAHRALPQRGLRVGAPRARVGEAFEALADRPAVARREDLGLVGGLTGAAPGFIG